ncbi:MAG TPA: sodium:proton antiporter [Pyrinomonadaceae bacterium]|nr:sodium:proton antiporter [Pyrinomonadaceae bacterium]
MFSVEQIALIVLIGAIVAIVARRLKIPYTVGLVVAGMIVAMLPIEFELKFSKELLFKVLLPPLIFEAAIHLRWRELRKDLSPIIVYATLGVLLSASVTASVMHFAVGWIWPAAVIFGVLIAATDPVSVIATFKEAKVEGRLRLLVEAESLFNDSTAAVAFTAALAFGLGQTFGIGWTAFTMLWAIAGGISSGLVVGGLALLIIGNTKDHLVELSMTTIAAFGSFWLAEHFELSGILATTTAGILVGNVTLFGRITEKGEEYIENFWDFAAFIVNAVVFVILGINVAYQGFAKSGLTILIAIIAVILGRAIAVYPCSMLFAWSSLKIERNHQHIMFWGGLRGALALALALGVPDSLPYRQEILTVTFGVVAFSVFVQGMTMTPLLRRLGQIEQHSKAAPTPDGA